MVVPNDINTDFIRAFRDIIIKHVHEGNRFVIIVGGGSTARTYIEAVTEVDPETTDEDRDWIGIHATRLNAQLMRNIFKKYAYPRVNTNPHDLEDFLQCAEPIIIAAGWRPGRSTDYCATLLAHHLSMKTIVNLSNIDYVYNGDPRTNPDATPQTQMNWKELRALVGDTWTPGLSGPFDPIASKFADEHNLSVVVMNGKNIQNLDSYLSGKDFVGTIISNDHHN
jgi:uridylate kinase